MRLPPNQDKTANRPLVSTITDGPFHPPRSKLSARCWSELRKLDSTLVRRAGVAEFSDREREAEKAAALEE